VLVRASLVNRESAKGQDASRQGFLPARLAVAKGLDIRRQLQAPETPDAARSCHLLQPRIRSAVRAIEPVASDSQSSERAPRRLSTAEGVSPKAFENSRLKWPRSLNPQANATDVTV
jgi:hypothetical protein